ncbi:MAG: transcriptional regulator [Thermosphaera sp.]
MSEIEYCSIYDIRFLIKKNIFLTPTLMRSLEAVITLKRATADDVARYTKRPRTIESRYLAQLNKIGIIGKEREGRRIFYLEPVSALKRYVEKFGYEFNIEQVAHQISIPADIARIIVEMIRLGKA